MAAATIEVLTEMTCDPRSLPVNDWIRGQRMTAGVVDFDGALRDPSDPSRLAPAYDSSDHLHPSVAGYRAMAAAVPLGRLIKTAAP